MSRSSMLPQYVLSSKGSCPLLVVDAMLGTLARWLRLVGYDAVYWRTGSDLELIKFARAEYRLIVTRDRALARRRSVNALLIVAERLDEQLAEARLGLGGEPEPFCRCPQCNGELGVLSVDEAHDRVPPYVWHTQHDFRICPDCGRVYWKGTHYPALLDRLERNG